LYPPLYAKVIAKKYIIIYQLVFPIKYARINKTANRDQKQKKKNKEKENGNNKKNLMNQSTSNHPLKSEFINPAFSDLLLILHLFG
jgi:hypothetical protein